MPELKPDWTLWKSFAEVVQHGSLSGAARASDLSQPTLGRHVEALEQHLGAALFERTLKGLKPTELGMRLYEQVEKAAQALSEAAMLAEGASVTPGGTVRITTSVVTGHFTLPEMLVPLRDEFPDIEFEIVPTDSPENLLMREADIAIRMFRPRQLELVARKIGESPIICCAHEDYLARRGVPESLEALRDHDLIGLDRSDLIVEGARAMGLEVHRRDFALRTDSQSLLWQLQKAGLGVGFAQKQLVERTEGMVAIDLSGLAIPPLEVWLTTHRELYLSRRIRAVYDRLADLLTGYFGGKSKERDD